MCKTAKPDSPVIKTAQKTSVALLAILDLDDNEDPKWHELMQVCRENLNELAQSPSRTPDDVLEKGSVLALLTTCDCLPDLRYLLAQSILEDAKSLGLA